MSRWRSISTLGIPDESLAVFAEHSESIYCGSLTDAGSADSDSDPHPSQVVCTRAVGDRRAEELHFDHTATILPAGDATEKVLTNTTCSTCVCVYARLCSVKCPGCSPMEIIMAIHFLQHPE